MASQGAALFDVAFAIKKSNNRAFAQEVCEQLLQRMENSQAGRVSFSRDPDRKFTHTILLRNFDFLNSGMHEDRVAREWGGASTRVTSGLRFEVGSVHSTTNKKALDAATANITRIITSEVTAHCERRPPSMARCSLVVYVEDPDVVERGCKSGGRERLCALAIRFDICDVADTWVYPQRQTMNTNA
jgi:hypothetical protein